MRFGQNPFKVSQQGVEPPAAVTVGVLNYIPDQSGYFAGQFEALKLCLTSMRQHAGLPFDLCVVDNGSCAEVRDYLCQELEAGRIQYLLLNARNLGKANAVFQILRSAPGDTIFYSDGDVYYFPGWMQAHLDVLENFPEAGIVGGIPLRDQANYYTASTLRWVEQNHAGLAVEKGDLIPAEWTRTFLHSIGEEHIEPGWLHDADCRITRAGTTAYVGASHMQFLISRRAVEAIPFKRFDHALQTEEDQHFDRHLQIAGYLRLSVSRPMVYHIGNAISEGWLQDEYQRLVAHPLGGALPSSVPVPGGPLPPQPPEAPKDRRHWLWKRRPVRRLLKALYEKLFKIYYANA